jgi:hypothetical protein
MAESLIVRKGGGGGVLPKLSVPTITVTGITNTSVTFSIKNNSNTTATIYYEHSDDTPDALNIVVGAGATQNVTYSGLSNINNLTFYFQGTASGFYPSNTIGYKVQVQQSTKTHFNATTCNWQYLTQYCTSSGDFYPSCSAGGSSQRSCYEDQYQCGYWPMQMCTFYQPVTGTSCSFGNYGSWSNVSSCVASSSSSCSVGTIDIQCQGLISTFIII